jgi:alpha-1,6-mannosyltransferase
MPNRTRGALACGIAVLACVAACIACAWPGASPLSPGLAGSLTGNRTWAWIYLGSSAAAFAAYAVGLRFLSSRGARLAAVGAVAAAIQLAPLAGPVLISSDAWTYWDYGRIAAVDGGNPYRDTPDDFSDEAAYQWVGGGWRDTTDVYGPAFTLASEPIGLAAGESHQAAAWIYKSLAALFVLLCTWLASRLSPRPAFAAAFVGWNPLLALHFAGGGHNDAWMAGLVLAALALAASGRRQLAGAAWALAVLVKWIPLVFLPLRLLEARAAGRRIPSASFGLTALVVAALATWRYGLAWLGAFGPLARNANKETRFALPHRLGELGVPTSLAIAICAAAFALAYLWLAREAWRGRARLGLAAALLLLTVPYLAAWYLVWTVPLAAAEDDRTAQWLTLGLTAYLLRQAVPI